jgi:hypothetical protein
MSTIKNAYSALERLLVILHRIRKMLGTTIKIMANLLYIMFHDCLETWSLTLKKERRLRVFENRVLGGIFGGKRDGVTGEWRNLRNEDVHDLYCSPNFVRAIKRPLDGQYYCAILYIAQ